MSFLIVYGVIFAIWFILCGILWIMSKQAGGDTMGFFQIFIILITLIAFIAALVATVVMLGVKVIL